MSTKSTPSAAVTEDFNEDQRGTELEMLKCYLLAGPTITEKLVLKPKTQKAQETQKQKVQDTRRFLQQWDRQWNQERGT